MPPPPKTFAAHGATVLLLGKTEGNLNQLYDEIEAAGHPQPVVIPFNLETALPHQYDELAATIEAEFGRLDGLLHNAAIIGPRTPLEQLSGDNFMRVMQVNVNAMFMLTSTLLPLLKLSRRRLRGIHLQQRRPQGPRLLGRLRRVQVRHRGPDADPGRRSGGRLPRYAPTASTPAPPAPACAPRPTPAKTRRSNPLPEAIMPVYLYLMGPDSRGVNGQAFDAQ